MEGRSFSGYILDETSNKVELRLMGGINQSISKKDINSRSLSKNSLMTLNLHTAIGKDKLTDLVEYLSSLKNYKAMEENPFQGKVHYSRGILRTK
jgi:putative heme-binding domain-containing protein